MENQYLICAYKNDGVVSPLLNDVAYEIMHVLTKDQGDVVFHSTGGFVSPFVNAQAATNVQLFGFDDVGICAMALSNVEVEKEGEAARVSYQAKVCYVSSDVVVSPNLLDGPISPSIVRADGGMVSPVTAGSVRYESLVEMPTVVMSLKGLKAQFVSDLGVTYLEQSI